MYMSDFELRRSWNNAIDRDMHLAILADLNGTSKKVMRKKLESLGISVPTPESKEMRLYKLGYTDQEIADAMHCRRDSICRWRNYHGLPVHRQKMGVNV